MTSKIKNIVTVVACSVFILGLSLWGLIQTDGETSTSERRPLAQFPELSWQTITNGDFMSKFETYTLDQFPMRDEFRTLKALASFYVMNKADNNDIYIEDGYAVKQEYPLNVDSIKYAANRFGYVFEKYLKDNDCNIYMSVVPDKNYFAADGSGHLSMDYEALVSELKNNAQFAEYIDIFDLLSLDDYYMTDTHWRQEKILDVAKRLASAMGVDLKAEYTAEDTGVPFYGVYYGQAALPLPPEKLYLLQNELFNDCTVFDAETNKTIGIYDSEKLNGKDPYEAYLSGSKSLLVIENPNATTDKELIIFRDSFGSSITPLLVEGYAKITVIDIRYITPAMLGGLVDFGGQDVLFLYSTLVLNNSSTIK